MCSLRRDSVQVNGVATQNLEHSRIGILIIGDHGISRVMNAWDWEWMHVMVLFQYLCLRVYTSSLPTVPSDPSLLCRLQDHCLRCTNFPLLYRLQEKESACVGVLVQADSFQLSCATVQHPANSLHHLTVTSVWFESTYIRMNSSDLEIPDPLDFLNRSKDQCVADFFDTLVFWCWVTSCSLWNL